MRLGTGPVGTYHSRSGDALGQEVAQLGITIERVAGSGPGPGEEPHRNLMNAPWWTDGNREVYLMTDDRVPLEKLDYFSWEK